jgi:Fibronectin type III domain
MQLGAVCCRARLSVFGLILSSVLMLVFQLPLRANESVTLAWNASTSLGVLGYIIYYGTASGSYSHIVLAGNTTRVTISGLVPGTTYYFAATTLGLLDNESGFSNEIRYTVPVTAATLTPVAGTVGQFGFAVSGDAGQQYVVQASTNLLDWTPLETNVAPFQFTDANTVGFHQRFYRVFYLAP